VGLLTFDEAVIVPIALIHKKGNHDDNNFIDVLNVE
jgi:hypothetical protein